MIKEIIFKGIHFKNYSQKEIDKLFDKNGLIVLPSGPGLSGINKDKIYVQALKNSDQVLLDSGYFVLLLKILKNISVKKISGYLFFKHLIKHLQKNKFKKLLSIEPNKSLSKNNNNLFLKKGLNKKKIIHYIAPKYNSFKLIDLDLLKLIKKNKPDYIVINIGGGVQEVLGYYLKRNFNNKLKIYCTGAAISYYTGDQAPLSEFFDNYYLGWFIRILYSPSLLFRYIKALKLLLIVKNSKIIIKN